MIRSKVNDKGCVSSLHRVPMIQPNKEVYYSGKQREALDHNERWREELIYFVWVDWRLNTKGDSE